MEKWINWKSITTALTLSALTGIGVMAKSFYGEYRSLVTTVSTHVSAEPQRMEQMQRQQIILEKIAKDIGEVKRATLTIGGLGKVQSDGGDESCMLVNTTGRAMMYRDMARARVTNMGSPEQQSVIVKINGTFQNANEENIVLLSKKAGALLDLQPGQVVRVRLEPIEEKQ